HRLADGPLKRSFGTPSAILQRPARACTRHRKVTREAGDEARSPTMNEITMTPLSRHSRGRRPRRLRQLVRRGPGSGAQRRPARMAGAILIAGLIGGLGAANAAQASTREATPPSSTPQQRVEALIKPSLVLITINASGEVDVPF